MIGKRSYSGMSKATPEQLGVFEAFELRSPEACSGFFQTRKAGNQSVARLIAELEELGPVGSATRRSRLDRTDMLGALKPVL